MNESPRGKVLRNLALRGKSLSMIASNTYRKKFTSFYIPVIESYMEFVFDMLEIPSDDDDDGYDDFTSMCVIIDHDYLNDLGIFGKYNELNMESRANKKKVRILLNEIIISINMIISRISGFISW